MEFVFHRVEIMVTNGENAPFPHNAFKAFPSGSLKVCFVLLINYKCRVNIIYQI